MRRIMIADASHTMCENISKRLSHEFTVACCHDGQAALEMIESFEPDVLVIDLMLPIIDGIGVVSTVRATERCMDILAITPTDSDYILMQMQRLDVQYVCRRPCNVDGLVCSIRQLAIKSELTPWCAEKEIDNILLQLGFSTSIAKYRNVHTAILLRYHGENGTMTKSLYPAVAAQCGGNAPQMEKSIRDAIKKAWTIGNRAVWNMYFISGQTERCPSNELFISRIARAIEARERIKKPYEAPCAKTENA